MYTETRLPSLAKTCNKKTALHVLHDYSFALEVLAQCIPQNMQQEMTCSFVVNHTNRQKVAVPGTARSVPPDNDGHHHAVARKEMALFSCNNVIVLNTVFWSKTSVNP